MNDEKHKNRPAAFRRHVFYIPGYDPIHPRRYRELYRIEGALQAKYSGYMLGLEPKRTPGPYGWHVRSDIEGSIVDTDVEVLVWSDIVRDSMSLSVPATYAQLFRISWYYISSRALFAFLRLRRGPVLAALYPIAVLLLQLFLACMVSGVIFWGSGFFDGSAFGKLAGWCGAAVCVGAILYWFKKQDDKFYAYYLMNDYAYSAQLKGAYPVDLEARLSAFRHAIAQALEGDYDEILVVGHSSGAHLAVSILADLLRGGQAPKTTLSLLTLGHVVPMVSFLPKAKRLRTDLHYLSHSPWLTWVDVTSISDVCTFGLCDPVAVSGVAPPDQKWPLMFSAAFRQTLKPQTWAALKWRFFRVHFQYLCAFDRLPGTETDYDYFRITAGPKNLGARYGRRQPSQNVIKTSVNPHRSIL